MATGSFTTPPNFPLIPGAVPSVLNQTGAFGPVVMFTAPVSGLYIVSGSFHVVATNGAGSVTITITQPHLTAGPVTLTFASGSDALRNPQLTWMNAGEQILMSATASGVTGSVYNCFVPIQQVL